MSELIPSQPWKSDNGGRRYTGHIAVGADASVNGTGQVNSILQDILGVGTANTVVGLQETFTGTADTYNTGLLIKAVANFGGAAPVVMGIEALGATLAGNAQNVTILAGFFGGSTHRGSGTVTFAYGMPGIAINTSSGNIGTAYGVYGSAQNSGSGTVTAAASLYAAGHVNTGGGAITTSYGLYLENQGAGGTNYNLYSAGSAASNYFEGYVRTASTGGFYMNALGSINNRFKINEPTAANAAAECIITPSATNRIPMVYQGLAAQSADLNQWEDSTGAVLSFVDATGKFGVLTTAINASAALQIGGSIYLDKETARTIKLEDTTTAATAGAALSILGANGSSTTSGVGGAVSITSGAGQAGNSGGGALNLTAGVGVGISSGGHVNIVGGAGLTGGSIILNGGNGVADGNVRLVSTDGMVQVGHSTAPVAMMDIQGRIAATPTLNVDNLAIAASIAIFKDNGTAVWTIANGGDLNAGEGINMTFGATTGTKIGTATTEKIGFFNKTPIVQPTALSTQLTSITHTAPGTPDYAIQDLTNAGGFGFATKDEGNTVLSVIANLQTRVAELEAKLSASGGGLGLIA